MKKIINGKVYDTKTAEWIVDNAGDRIYGHNTTRVTILFRTKKGRFFTQFKSQWQGEDFYLEALTEEEAFDFFQANAGTDDVDRIGELFPTNKVEEA
jgi:hypothetical protein